MKRICSTLAIVLACYCSYAQNNFPNSGDASINTSIPSGHGAGYSAIWMPNATALMPENDPNYAAIYLTANIIRSPTLNNWTFANSSLSTWRLSMGNGPYAEGFGISRSAPTTFQEQPFFVIRSSGNVGIWYC